MRIEPGILEILFIIPTFLPKNVPHIGANKATLAVQAFRVCGIGVLARHCYKFGSAFHSPQQLRNNVAAQSISTMAFGHLNPLQDTLTDLTIQFRNTSCYNRAWSAIIKVESQSARKAGIRESAHSWFQFETGPETPAIRAVFISGSILTR